MSLVGSSELWYLSETDQIIESPHMRRDCDGACPIHKPTKHHLSSLPLGYDLESSLFYRVCLCGNAHLDPDVKFFWIGRLDSDAYPEAMRALTRWFCPDCDCSCCAPHPAAVDSGHETL